MPPTCTIQRMHLDGSGNETFAYNIRDAAGFAFHPTTTQLFFTSVERSGMGVGRPDDGLFASAGSGIDYDYPYCHWYVGWHGCAWLADAAVTQLLQLGN